MLWPGFGESGWGWDPWMEFRRLQREVRRVLDGSDVSRGGDFPAVNVWSGPEDTVVTAETPGIDPNDLDITVLGNTLTIRGNRQPDQLEEGETCHRRERGYGRFGRTLELPYAVDADAVEATYGKGMLRLTLPRAEADKPKKITVAGT